MIYSRFVVGIRIYHNMIFFLGGGEEGESVFYFSLETWIPNKFPALVGVWACLLLIPAGLSSELARYSFNASDFKAIIQEGLGCGSQKHDREKELQSRYAHRERLVSHNACSARKYL